MIALECACAAIVLFYLAVRVPRPGGGRALVGRLALLAASSFVVEDSVIRAYGFYHYAPRWHLFVDRVPLLIVVIWPIVIHSAWDLAGHLVGARRRALVAAAIVLADASLIEPIAVAAKLWAWSEPGLFHVPPIGILGWAFFAWACLALVERWGAAIVLLAPAATHALLLASWWGCFRWVSRPLAPWPLVGAAWALALLLVAVAARRRVARRVPLAELVARAPAGGFFFVLLALVARDAALTAWSLAFVPPWLALFPWYRSRP